MLELSLLKTLSNKENYETYKSYLNPKTLSSQSLLLLQDYNKYYVENPIALNIDWDLFKTLFFNKYHPNLDETTVLEYKEILRRIYDNPCDTKEADQIVNAFKQQEFYKILCNMVETNVDLNIIKDQIEKYEETVKTVEDKDLIDMDIDKALDYTDRSKGLQFRLKCLKDHIGSLIQGDFLIVAGYVDSGKSSFIASELSHMSQQLEGDDYILWMSNEGDWKSILPRLWCSTLNCTQIDLTNNKDKAKLKYKEMMKGDVNRIRIVDIQGWTAKDIEKLIKRKCPKLAVIDLMDHISGFDKFLNKESSFEKYSKLYQWAREMSNKYCPIIGISQLNGDGEDQMYPPMSKLRGSRVDKQAAATCQLMIGSIQGQDNVRYLSMPKNKINSNKSWKAIVQFDADRCRFVG